MSSSADTDEMELEENNRAALCGYFGRDIERDAEEENAKMSLKLTDGKTYENAKDAILTLIERAEADPDFPKNDLADIKRQLQGVLLALESIDD